MIFVNDILNAIEKWFCTYPPVCNDIEDMKERTGSFWTNRKAKAYPPGRGPEKYWIDLSRTS
jgi:hypothetical protein